MKQTLKRLLQFAAPYRRRLASVLFFSFFSCLIVILLPYFLGQAIDRMLGPGQVDFAGLTRILIWLGAFYLSNVVLSYLMTLLTSFTVNSLIRDLLQQGFAKIHRLPIPYLDSHKHGDILSLFVNDADTLSDGLIQSLGGLFTGVMIILGTLTMMLILNPLLTLMVLLVTSLTFLVASRITRATRRTFREQQELVGQINAYTEEVLGGQKTIQAFSYGSRAEKVFAQTNQQLYTVGQRAQFVASLTNPCTRFVNHLAYIAVGVCGVLLAGLTAGGISSFVIYAMIFAGPFNDLTHMTGHIMAGIAAAERLFQFFDTPEEIPEPPDAVTLQDPEGSVVFDHVSFSYTPDRPLIQDFSLQVAPGQRIAIVGPTGAGKTTLMNLLMRFYDVDSGKILLEGHDLRQIRRESLRKSFGMVLQDTWLLEDTVRANIAYSRPDASMEDIVTAAKEAHAHSFIKRLPQGYDTPLEEAGQNLSAGQKQLLTIARLMLADPALLILDEATSSVDTLTEQRVQKGIVNLLKGRTSFIIAHRLSTIRDADQILVMRDGQIVEQGTHTSLLQLGGFYKELFESQFEAG